MIYKTAEYNDLKGILELYKQLNHADPIIVPNIAETIWEKILTNENIKYFIAIENGIIVSACNICIVPNLTRSGKSYGIIENVITDISHRKKGIGKQIICSALEFAKIKNCYKVVLLSNSKRREAHIFYEKLGFDGDSKKGYEIRFN